ncbi:hypothetical protein [Enterocloster bolteae]|uniref:hypothetical protein n=1 Tax=Enterocloster bolteae TaxID=208479 RepID=UPI003AF0DE69
MGYAGEGAGKALADLLFGAACPGEKLAATHQRLPLSISDSGSLIVLPRRNAISPWSRETGIPVRPPWPWYTR